MYACMYVCAYVRTYVRTIYIYIYREREREIYPSTAEFPKVVPPPPKIVSTSLMMSFCGSDTRYAVLQYSIQLIR